MKNNNIRGGKQSVQTKVKVVGGLIEQWGSEAGFYMYDRRVWVKDPAWENSKWHTNSYRANDDHPAKFPCELARRVIRLLSKPGDLVLDCFVGSGTTAMVAIQEGRHYLG